ncbi:uncharacterized protein LOC105698214 [Orussus abietinus]|uniref:uncharacterized protein LOC105698214 n=1 Tax=Orussus abietinus TaxID=222816 RepID=UPI00062601C1|nr:uncharacterized protein LOC105698214 [Orussus abietinus]
MSGAANSATVAEARRGIKSSASDSRFAASLRDPEEDVQDSWDLRSGDIFIVSSGILITRIAAKTPRHAYAREESRRTRASAFPDFAARGARDTPFGVPIFQDTARPTPDKRNRPTIRKPYRFHCILNTSAFAMALLIKVLLCCAVVYSALAQDAGDQSPKSRISDQQLNMALSDERYLRRQLKCALGEAPCDPVGRRLKSLAPLVLRGTCPQCTAEETRQIKKVLSHVQRAFPKEWSKIVQQYAGF